MEELAWNEHDQIWEMNSLNVMAVWEQSKENELYFYISA